MSFLGGLGKIGRGALAVGTFGTSELAKKGFDKFGGSLMGTSGQDATYIDPRLQEQNLNAALTSGNIRNINLTQAQAQLPGLYNQFAQVGQGGPSASDLVGNSIEQQRRAMALGNQNTSDALNRNIAKRGLGGSAAGLFAAQNQETAMNNNLANLEGSRVGSVYSLGNQMQDRTMQQKNAILGQINSINSGIQMPSTSYMNPAKQGTKGLIPSLLPAAGTIAGGLFGGPAGAMAGGAIGQGVGDMFSRKQRQNSMMG